MSERNSQAREEIAKWTLRRYAQGKPLAFGLNVACVIEALIYEDPLFAEIDKTGESPLSRIRNKVQAEIEMERRAKRS